MALDQLSTREGDQSYTHQQLLPHGSALYQALLKPGNTSRNIILEPRHAAQTHERVAEAQAIPKRTGRVQGLLQVRLRSGVVATFHHHGYAAQNQGGSH